jgi:hypothetical protein
MDFSSSFCTLKMIPLHVQSPAEIYIVFGGIFHARKNLSLGHKQRNLLCSLPVSMPKLLSKIIHFGCIFGKQIDIMFGLEFGVENRPKKESFGVNFYITRETYSQTGRHVWMPCFGLKNPSASAVRDDCGRTNIALVWFDVHVPRTVNGLTLPLKNPEISCMLFKHCLSFNILQQTQLHHTMKPNS